VDLKQKLMLAGVTDIFGAKANFSAISETKLYVENVLHIAKIKVSYREDLSKLTFSKEYEPNL
jgi:serine protease inhibitor